MFCEQVKDLSCQRRIIVKHLCQPCCLPAFEAQLQEILVKLQSPNMSFMIAPPILNVPEVEQDTSGKWRLLL